MGKLSLRPATRDDARMIFEWRNDPWIVERGSSNRTVTWDEHQTWFARALENSYTKIFVIHVGDSAAGQVRLQRSGDDAEITVYLLKDYTGRGHGVTAIREGASLAFAAWPVRRVVARILLANKESKSAFEKAGFTDAALQSDASHTEMTLERGG
jgi:UDP-2,4-diacetamido-2,4,6-trideoxy-beta-L-altropyranose hydrolase